jgi:hypothetical protein
MFRFQCGERFVEQLVELFVVLRRKDLELAAEFSRYLEVERRISGGFRLDALLRGLRRTLGGLP